MCKISFSHFLKASCEHSPLHDYLPHEVPESHCLSKTLHHRPQQRRAIRSSWHKMSGLSWINFNFRSQHFTFDRWKLVSPTEINLKRRLSLNLNLLGDIITHIYSRLVTCEIKMIHTFHNQEQKPVDMSGKLMYLQIDLGWPSRQYMNRHDRIQ